MTEAAARQIIPVILSGGSGTRLFPISRELWPKQLLTLTSNRSLIQETADRVRDFGPPIIISNQEHRFAIAQQMREIGILPLAHLLEPAARNTAAAIAAVAHWAHAHAPGAMLLVLPSDHAIAETSAFLAAIDCARSALQSETGLATFGIYPQRPETGYGYIEIGEKVSAHPGVHRCAGFREKPDQATAAGYLSGGKHVWNSGMFLFSIASVLEELERFAPEIARGAKIAVDQASQDLDFIRLETAAFSKLPSISIDYAVMEKTARAIVVPCDIGWSDVGSFGALWDIGAKDDAGNVATGDVMIEDVANCYLSAADNMLLLGIGLKDLAVIATDDAILVADRTRSDEVKALVARLKAQGRSETGSHRKVHRPWGSYETIGIGHHYQVKRIELVPGASISLQKHFHRAEHWVIVNGTALVHRDGEEKLLSANESTYIPIGAVHRLTNPGKIPLVLIEVQSGAYLSEDDIVRFDDHYNRV